MNHFMMNKSAKTKLYILDKAAPLFNSKGYAGTSLSDLTATTGLTKGGIYGNFVSKEELALSAFNFAITKTRSHINQELALVPKAIDKLYILLDVFLKSVFNPPVAGGCILLNTSVEADDTEPLLKEQVAYELSVSVNHIADLLEKAIEAGELTNTFNPKSTAYNIFCAIEGAIMMSRAQSNIQPMQEVVSYWKTQINQYSNKFI